MSQTSTGYDFLAKAIILGESSVGKTSIFNRYFEGKFYTNYLCSIGIEFRVKTFEIDGKKVKIQIWDTAGQERFRAVARPYYRGAQGVILCYAIDNRESFEKIEYWMEEVKKYKTEEGICFVIVGTKSDLSDKRVVSIDEGRLLAELYGVKFFETSAKDNLNISEPFLTLAKDVSVVLSNKKSDTQEAGNQLHPEENDPKAQINCFKCS